MRALGYADWRRLGRQVRRGEQARPGPAGPMFDLAQTDEARGGRAGIRRLAAMLRGELPWPEKRETHAVAQD